MIAVDASVAVKWFLPEPGSEAAERLLTGSRKLLAPDLIRIEVAAAITRRARLNEITDDQAGTLLAAWSKALAAGAVTLAPVQDDLEQGIELALCLRHPLQDCLYLALAARLHVPLVTADRALAARAAAVHPETRELGAWSVD